MKGAEKNKRQAFRATLEGSPEAKKLSAVVLESLAGVRSPQDAAKAAGISVQRFYVLETRALQGMVRSLEPRRKGRQRGAEDLLAAAVKEKERLARDLGRTQALLRSAHRVIGVQSVTSTEKSDKIAATGKRRRRPVARAVKAVAVLRASGEAEPQAATSPTS
jgi:hypothetical protein